VCHKNTLKWLSLSAPYTDEFPPTFFPSRVTPPPPADQCKQSAGRHEPFPVPFLGSGPGAGTVNSAPRLRPSVRCDSLLASLASIFFVFTPGSLIRSISHNCPQKRDLLWDLAFCPPKLLRTLFYSVPGHHKERPAMFNTSSCNPS